ADRIETLQLLMGLFAVGVHLLAHLPGEPGPVGAGVVLRHQLRLDQAGDDGPETAAAYGDGRDLPRSHPHTTPFPATFTPGRNRYRVTRAALETQSMRRE